MAPYTDNDYEYSYPPSDRRRSPYSSERPVQRRGVRAPEGARYDRDARPVRSAGPERSARSAGPSARPTRSARPSGGSRRPAGSSDVPSGGSQRPSGGSRRPSARSSRTGSLGSARSASARTPQGRRAPNGRAPSTWQPSKPSRSSRPSLIDALTGSALAGGPRSGGPVAGDDILARLAHLPWKTLLLALVAVIVIAFTFTRISSCVHSGQSAERNSFVSTSIINQTQPVAAPGDASTYLAKKAEARRAEAHRAQIEQLIAKQKERISQIPTQANLDDRDQLFRRGASLPDNYEPADHPVVYLTFDDGPSQVTPEVLDVLDFYGAKATFFVTNLNPSYAGMIKEAYQRGHTIGLHTSTHEFSDIYSSTDAYFADIDAVAATVRNQIGYEPMFLRFAGGSSNTISTESCIGIMSVLSDEVQQRGYQYYDWNFDSADASGSLSVNEIVEASTTATPEENGNSLIMLLHDGRTKQTTAEALPFIIENYLSKGYSFEALTPDTMIVHQPIAN